MKTYTIEVESLGNIVKDGRGPKEVLENYIKEQGYRAEIISEKKVTTKPKDARIAKVCLLGGVSESVSYYYVYNIQNINNHHSKLYMNLYKTILALDLKCFLCSSFDEAKKSKLRGNIVLVDDGIYLTWKMNGQFGELYSWVDDEFEEDENLYRVVENALKIYKQSPVKVHENIRLGNIQFTAY